MIERKKYNHFKVVAVSIYTDDLVRLDQMVEALKIRGQKHASRSALIRFALRQVKLDDVRLPR
jgi:hypothetical protein